MNSNIITLKGNILYLAFAVLFLTSCQSEQEQESDKKEKPSVEKGIKKVKETKERVDAAQKIFYTIPSPLETVSLFKKAGADYNKSLLNPVGNVDEYSTNKKKALNLGVYGADLSYSSIFEKTQQSIHYLNCASQLAEGLDINRAFSNKTALRLEKNLNNRDSLLTIISDSYWKADGFLKENNRENISALIITGGWIEGLYLGSHSLDNEKEDTKLAKRVAEQKYSYNHLIKLLKTFPEDSDVKDVLSQLNKLDEAYGNIEIESIGKATATKDENTGVTTIEGGDKVVYTPEDIAAIKSVVAEIRTNFITP